MKDIRILEQRLLALVGSKLRAHGFSEKPVGQSFRRSISLGWAAVHLAFVRHAYQDLDVIADVAIRFDEVQKIILEDDELVSSADRRNSATIGCELGNLLGSGQVRWTITSLADAEIVANSIVFSSVEHFLPFIEKFSSLQYVLKTLKSDESMARLICPFAVRREKTILAIASLLSM